MPIVQVRNLVKRYTPDSPNAVDDISFDIHTGEMFSLLGPNGAGKTTVISMISTLLSPTAGTVTVAGHDTQQSPMNVRRSIGVVPQELALYADLTAHENLRFWGEMRGLRGVALKSEIVAKLALTDLTDRAKDRVQTFSGGMKRRLNLAIGLLGNPKFVMLDEPTVAIDPQSRRYILDWIKKMSQQGITVLYTTHYMEEAQELSDRIGIIDHGKLIALGTLDDLTQMVDQHETLILTLTQHDHREGLIQALATQHGILQASRADSEDNRQVLLNVQTAEAALPGVISTAAGLDIGIRTIEIREPNLETVFLHLTGRALRD